MSVTLRRVPLLALTLTAIFAAPPAAATGKQECIQASERGQQLRDEGKLTEARQQLLLCVQESCPRPVIEACRDDLNALEKRLPSVVFGAKGPDGSDIVDVTVQLDGATVAQRLDGRAVTVNPGPHRVRMDAAGKTSEEQIVVIEGEKSRPVRLTLRGAGAPTPATPGPTPSPTTPERPTESASGGVSPLVFVFGGLGVASLGAFAFLGLSGTGEINDMRDTCGKTQTCAQKDVDAAKTKLLIGDVFLGVGIVSAGLATYFALTPKKEVPLTVGVKGTSLELRGAF